MCTTPSMGAPRPAGPQPCDGLRRALPRLSRHALGGGAFVQDHDLDAPVLLTARRRVVRDDRVLGPIALGGDPIAGDAARHELIPNRLGALLRELLVEVFGAGVVGVALQPQVARRGSLE